MFKAAFTSLLVTLMATGQANAWFRVACANPLVQERIDPIISPGSVPSQHVHTINGGHNFATSSTYNQLRASSCSNCEVVPQDFSNYWYPKLYFQDPVTKKFEDVSNGGLLVYYQNRGDLDVSNGGPGLKAFPAGFKMVSGNPIKRSKLYPVNQGSQGELAERAIQWACLRYSAPNGTNLGYDNSASGAGFPTTDCESGFNARIHMPACWDGVNLDPPDHTSHVAYLSGLDNGACPSTHPVGLMKLFYEVTWSITGFASRWNPATQPWPFVYAPGDPTGYGWHGDFQNGWDVTALQNAIDHCNNPNDQTGQGVTAACSYLTVTTADTANQCTLAPVVTETITGTQTNQLTHLPGCNPVQWGPPKGPVNATLYTAANCPAGDS